MTMRDAEGHDHLAALSMADAGTVSGGRYTPDRLDLALTGADQVTDLLVYVHEVHHQALNDSTAWGAALHVLSALGPSQRACFGPMLDACRLPHEAYATFAAVSIVGVHHQGADAALAHFPRYERLYRTLASMTPGAGGPHREYLLATALARAAMQSPVLTVMLGSADLNVAPSDLRAIDTPAGRWRWLMRAGRDLTDPAAVVADKEVTATLGTTGLEADTATHPGAAAADELDGHWELWERAAYAVLAEALTDAGATVLGFNGHMEPTGDVLERARKIDPALLLRAARPHSPAPDDAALSASTIQYVRLTLTDPPRPARLHVAPIGELAAAIATDTSDPAPPTPLVLHARLPRRMRDSYRWPAEDLAVLDSAESPIVAIRRIEPDAEASAIVHALLTAPADLQALTSETAGGVPDAITVAGASCFVDAVWCSTWLPAIRDAGPLVILIDIEAERFVSSWVRTEVEVRAGTVRIEDTGGVYWATGLVIGEDPTVWLHLGDETTVKLLLDQLRRTDGLRLNVSPEHVRDAAPLLTHVITQLLATESFLDLQGLDAATIRRVTAGDAAS